MKKPRDFVQRGYYHVYNRGHHRATVFLDSVDRRYFISKLDEFCERDDIDILAYCLMDNHFHLALRQNGSRPISSIMHSLLMGYVRFYNQKHTKVGGLFQGRFQAKLVRDNEYLAHLSRYIHLNPHPFSNYRTYRWSSYREFIGTKTGICNPGTILDFFGGSKTSYAIYVEKAVSPGEPA